MRRLACIGVFALDPVHVGWWDGHFREQRLMGHAVIALRIRGWYVAFIAPEDMNLIPGHLPTEPWVGRQQSVEAFRRRAPREGYRKRAFGDDSLTRQAHK